MVTTIKELEKYSPNDTFYDVKNQLRKFIYDRCDEAFAGGEQALNAVSSTEELEKRRIFMREKLIESFGGLPESSPYLNSKVTGILKCNGYRIEKIILESRPNVFVTTNMYIPDGIEAKTPAVLFLCGHAEIAKHYDRYQCVCQCLVKSGIIVLAADPVGQGERFSYYEKKLSGYTVEWGCPEHSYAGCQCLPLGDGLARYFVHDAIRSIDYLCTRPEVDTSKIGVTGSSGGGTQTSLVMLCDPRVAVAAPGTFIMNFQENMYTGLAQDCEQIWRGMAALGFDHEDILLSMVPKPVLVLSATSDFFPIEGTRKTFGRVKRFWDMYGKPENLEMFEDDVEHQYSLKMAVKSAEFFSKDFFGEKKVFDLESIIPFKAEQLQCTQSGQVRGEIDGARFVYEENLERLNILKARRSVIPDDIRRMQAFDWLRNKVYKGRKLCALNPRGYRKDRVGELIVHFYIWWAQEGIFNNAFIFRHMDYEDKVLPVTLALWNNGTNELSMHYSWIRKECNKGRLVMVLDISGEGSLEPYDIGGIPKHEFEGTIYGFQNNLQLLGDSLAAMRIHDVIRALDTLELIPFIKKDDIRMYANGRHGVYAEIAAFIDERVKDIETVNGMESYEEWVISRLYEETDISSIVIPESMKYFDLPDLKRWR